MLELNKQLLEVLEDNKIQEKIKNLYCKLHRNSFENSNFPGWKWSILVDTKGKVESVYSNGDVEALREYANDAIIVAEIVDEAEVLPEDLGDIKLAPQYDEFIECLIEDFIAYKKVDPNSLDFEQKKLDYIEENSTWSDYYEFDEQDYEKLEIQAWKEYSETYAYDEIQNKLQDVISDLKSDIEHMESYN